MDLDTWLAFTMASTVLLIIPGPTILTVIGYSVSHGYSAKVPLIIAVALGDSTALALSLLGLGALMAESAFWFQMVKWAGGLYLLFLGARLLMARVKLSGVQQDLQMVLGWKLFFNTYLVTALNPKGIVFFVAFLPLFIDSSSNVIQQLWLLAVTFVALATLNATLYAIFAGKARRLLSSPQTRRNFNFAGGSMLFAAGIWALSAKQT
ncbi:MAG: LysE family translocator [Gammaproteobacteria bacterium]|nr:MAG: LysE family translocator [Gammaproteobacteria bacterium]